MASSVRWLLCAVALIASPVFAKPVSVVLATVEASPGQSVLPLVGELRAWRRAVLSAEVAGPVAEVLVERGDQVAAGAAMASIREQPARFGLRAAQGRAAQAAADVDRAEINERRIGRLLQRKATSQDEYDTVHVELDKARAILATRRAEVELAADLLARHQVRAPFASVVVERLVEQGQWLDVGSPCYVVEELSRLRAVLAVPQRHFEQVRPGGEASLSYDALPGEVFHATVTRKLPLVNQQGRSFEIWLEVDNEDRRLVSGLSLQAQIPLHIEDADWVLVPRDAVQRSTDSAAWLWRAKTAEQLRSGQSAWIVDKVDLVVVATVGQRLMVRGSGLVEGMQVVVRGNEALREGQIVVAAPER